VAAAPKSTGDPPEPATSADDLFKSGLDFDYQTVRRISDPTGKPSKDPAAGDVEIKGRVWAHPDAKGKKCPLLVYLHGNNNTANTQQNFPQLHTPVGAKYAKGMLHAGKLLQGENVEPLIIAAPSAWVNIWWSEYFELGSFVKQVKDALAGQVEIDFKRIVVTGHSGAGGIRQIKGKDEERPPMGLTLIAKEGGTFTAGDTPFTLTLLGVMDNSSSKESGKRLREGLPNTAIYAVDRTTGGWSDGPASSFREGLLGGNGDRYDAPEVAEDERVVIESARVVGKDTPAERISILVKYDDKTWKTLDGKWAGIAETYKLHAGWDHHFDTIPAWTLWVARRYFANP